MVADALEFRFLASSKVLMIRLGGTYSFRYEVNAGREADLPT